MAQILHQFSELLKIGNLMYSVAILVYCILRYEIPQRVFDVASGNTVLSSLNPGIIRYFVPHEDRRNHEPSICFASR